MAKKRTLIEGVSQIVFEDDLGGVAPAQVITNSDGNALLSDEYGALVLIPFVHHKIHEGKFFGRSFKTPDGADVADNGSIWALLIVGNEDFHATFGGVAGGDAEGWLYENVQASASGTAMSIFNYNRSSSNTFSGLLFDTPTLSSSGTAIVPGWFIPGGAGPQAGGGTTRTGVERKLKANTAYAARLINRAGTAQPMGMTLEGYEQED